MKMHCGGSAAGALVVVVVVWGAGGGRCYSDLERDPLDLERVARDPALLRQTADCFTDRAPCTPDQQQYKNHALEAVGDGCRECGRRDKHFGHVFLAALARDLPDQYRQFRDKYDPRGRRLPALLAELDNY